MILGERALIARVRARVPLPPDWVLTGIGDDGAVIEPGRGMVDVVTTDALVEDVHFRRAWSSPSDIGHKALAVNLSDLAAMGASPRALLLSLALPAELPLDDFDGLIDGFLALAAQVRAPLVGGNLTRSPGPLTIDVTAIGSARPRRILRRAGAHPGDRVFVTGRLGAAAAGLALFQSGAGPELRGKHAELSHQRECLVRYARPDARLRTGMVVARNRAASACMDVSDGLADAASQLAHASGCRLEIDAAAIPVHPGASLPMALSGGEDYELLFAVPRRRTRLFLAAVRQAGETTVTEIGVCTKGTTACLIVDGKRTDMPEGFEHKFR